MRRAVLAMALSWLLAVPTGAVAAGDPLRSHQWALDMIEADSAHQAGSTGVGAVVAVVDTGVQADHPDLAGRLLPGHDFVDGDDTPQDGNGHGTHVTGIIAADANNGIGIEGVAPSVSIVPIRVLGDDGSGDTSNVAAGIDYAVSRHVDVINLSLGSDTPLMGANNGELDAAIGRALNAGIVVVAAAGNNTLPICDQPSAQGGLLCVGAVDRRRHIAGYSNFGYGLGITAPGGQGSAHPSLDEDIASTWKDSGYAIAAGTSQATPHVSAVAALLAAKGIHGQDAVNRILATAQDADVPGPNPIYGAGIVDARAAVAGLSPDAPGTGGVGGTGAGTGQAQLGLGNAARVTIARVLRIRDVLRQSIRVRCVAAGRGRCRVEAWLGRRKVAAGSQALAAGRPATVVARLTRNGRRRIAGARRVRLSVRIWLPGAPMQVRSVQLVR